MNRPHLKSQLLQSQKMCPTIHTPNQQNDMNTSSSHQEQLPTHPVMQVEWPDKIRGEHSLPDTCELLQINAHYQEFLSSIHGLQAMHEVPCPILAVIGQLNSGKSSLVERFLSPDGRARVLTGTGSREGTQRFVFWLPQTWKENSEIMEAFMEELSACFGDGYEDLSEDPQDAQVQYNGSGDIAKTFAVPLIAFDPNLEHFAFLDAPDFERSHPGVNRSHTARKRVKLVSKASRLVSALLFVAKADNYPAENASAPFKLYNPGDNEIPVYLLINKLDHNEKDTESLSQDPALRALMSTIKASRLFVAYNGYIADVSEHIPACVQDESFNQRLPYFFEVGDHLPHDTHNDFDQERLLENVTAKLNPSELWQNKIQAYTKNIEEQSNALELKIKGQLQSQQEHLQFKLDGLTGFITSQVSKDGELSFPITTELTAQINDAIQKTIPWYAVPAMWSYGLGKEVFKTIKNMVNNAKTIINPSHNIQQGADNIAKSIKEGELHGISANDLTEKSRGQRFMPTDIAAEDIHSAWLAVLSHSYKFHATLDQSELERFSRNLWDNVPILKKVALAAFGPLLLLASLAAALIAAFDGGGTILMVFSVQEVILASGIGGVGGVATLLGAGELDAHLKKNAGVPFFRRLVHSAVDTFCLPRQLLQHTPPNKFKGIGTINFTNSVGNTDGHSEPLLPIICDISESNIIASTLPKAWEQLKQREPQ